MTEEYVVDVNNLSKCFAGKQAVIDLSMKIPKGQIFGFLGPNGSGKTTTIRMLCGLLVPDAGEGRCLGFDIMHEAQSIKPLIGYVPQSFGLYKDLTVRENLEFVARVYGMHDYKSCTKDMMAQLGLVAYENILAGGLSGGWKQRLSLAAALIHEPQLLLLDEPTAGVDPKARREFWDDIVALTQKGITALVSTHYMDEAERCNSLAYIVYGRLMAEGTIPEIVAQAGLSTWSATNKKLLKFSDKLKKQPGVDQVVIWGNELRLTGSDPNKLEKVTQQYSEFNWHKVRTGLEEVFVYFVAERAEESKEGV